MISEKIFLHAIDHFFDQHRIKNNSCKHFKCDENEEENFKDDKIYYEYNNQNNNTVNSINHNFDISYAKFNFDFLNNLCEENLNNSNNIILFKEPVKYSHGKNSINSIKFPVLIKEFFKDNFSYKKLKLEIIRFKTNYFEFLKCILNRNPFSSTFNLSLRNLNFYPKTFFTQEMINSNFYIEKDNQNTEKINKFQTRCPSEDKKITYPNKNYLLKDKNNEDFNKVYNYDFSNNNYIHIQNSLLKDREIELMTKNKNSNIIMTNYTFDENINKNLISIFSLLNENKFTFQSSRKKVKKNLIIKDEELDIHINSKNVSFKDNFQDQDYFNLINTKSCYEFIKKSNHLNSVFNLINEDKLPIKINVNSQLKNSLNGERKNISIFFEEFCLLKISDMIINKFALDNFIEKNNMHEFYNKNKIHILKNYENTVNCIKHKNNLNVKIFDGLEKRGDSFNDKNLNYHSFNFFLIKNEKNQINKRNYHKNPSINKNIKNKFDNNEDDKNKIFDFQINIRINSIYPSEK